MSDNKEILGVIKQIGISCCVILAIVIMVIYSIFTGMGESAQHAYSYTEDYMKLSQRHEQEIQGSLEVIAIKLDQLISVLEKQTENNAETLKDVTSLNAVFIEWAKSQGLLVQEEN